MREKLLQLLNNAYAPYSKYKVAAIAVTDDGTLFGGVNVENASFGATICAERNAVNQAIAMGYKKGNFKELYVLVDGSLAFPCFICRQTLNEFYDMDDKLILMNKDEMMEYTMREVLTHPFGQEDLR